MDVPVLDRSKFTQTVNLVAIKVPARSTSIFMSSFKEVIWRTTKPIIPDPSDENKKLILLDKSFQDLTLNQLNDKQKEIIKKHAESVKFFPTTIGYEQMTTDEVLKQIVPKEIELVTSFETIGHIAHMNLRDDCLPYRKVIGEVILDKNKTISSVVNKTGEIDTVFRTFKMELLAGKDDYFAEVHESGCRFQFNFAEVYWNSRLGTEHERLVKLFKPDQVICDMFCGVGPFAIPAAKAGCIVYANDLNPASYKYLEHNAKLNKVDRTKLFCFNLDGRDFVRHLVVGDNPSVPKLARIDHVVMNLPASAVTFLDVFNGLFPQDVDPELLPTIHCYGFTKSPEPEKDILEQCVTYLGMPIQNPSITVVRTVSSYKLMMRVSFKLPGIRDIRFSEIEEQPDSKRQKT